MPTYYLRVEGVNLSHFVYDSKDLSTIRGGSLLLLHAVDSVEQKLAKLAKPVEAITTGASSGIFRFEAGDDCAAGNVRDSIAKELQDDNALRHATFVVDVTAPDTEGNFVSVRERLIAMNRWRQAQSLSVALPPYNDTPGGQICDVDRLRLATRKETRIRDGEPEGMSDSVYRRWKYGREQKQEFYTHQTEIAAIPLDFAQDLDKLTGDPSKGNLHHKMAVVYVDGNKFGELQNRLCRTEARQRDFDKTLKDYRKAFLTELVRSMEEMDAAGDRSWISSENTYRLETLLWGGDEFTLIVPAWKGWDTLELFYQQAKDWHFDGQQLYHAAGLVFCHHNAPIHRIKLLAEDLARLAKEKDSKANCFAYEILESFDHIGRDLERYRRERSVKPCDFDESPNPAELILNGEQMAEARRAVISVKESVARRKLHALTMELLSSSSTKEKRDSLADDVFRPDSPPGSDKAAEALKRAFGNYDYAYWLHTAALWDYLVRTLNSGEA